jgi:acetyl esterase/lipase
MAAQDVLDAEVAQALAGHPLATFDWGRFDVSDVPALRASLSAPPSPDPPPPATAWADHQAPGWGDDPAVTVRVFGPADPSEVARPCVYWIHGGGYTYGSAFQPEPRVQRWVDQLGCVVASPEYRLAPEHRFPAPLDDCYAGLLWLSRHAEQLGVDATRIVVGGPSAGGGLAAGLCLLARDRGEVDVAYQMLIYPTLDDRDRTPSSHLATVICPRELVVLSWRCYLGTEPGGPDVSAYAAPARADDLAGLPPTFVGVGTRDVLRDEAIEYGRRLMEAGVPTELHVYPGVPHGFEIFAPRARLSVRFEGDIDDALRRAWSARP